MNDTDPENFEAVDGNHTAGEMREGVQRCVMCGGIIIREGEVVVDGAMQPIDFERGHIFKQGQTIGSGWNPALKECEAP